MKSSEGPCNPKIPEDISLFLVRFGIAVTPESHSSSKQTIIRFPHPKEREIRVSPPRRQRPPSPQLRAFQPLAFLTIKFVKSTTFCTPKLTTINEWTRIILEGPYTSLHLKPRTETLRMGGQKFGFLHQSDKIWWFSSTHYKIFTWARKNCIFVAKWIRFCALSWEIMAF